jgi:hypothetical protein
MANPQALSRGWISKYNELDKEFPISEGLEYSKIK